MQRGFTDEQLAQIRSAFRAEFSGVGLRIDDPEQQDAAREDMRWLRRMRLGWDGASTRIGNAVLAAVILVAGAIIGSGFWAWISTGGKPPT
jgi:hypothetical protein